MLLALFSPLAWSVAYGVAALPDANSMAALIAQLPAMMGRYAAVAARMDDRRTLATLYMRRQGAMLWSRSGSATTQCRHLVDTLQHAAIYGLSAGDYDAELLAAHLLALEGRNGAVAGGWPAFDLALSRVALIFLSDLHYGRIDPRAAGFNLPARPDRLDGAALLEQLSMDPDTTGVLSSVEPQYAHYRLLRTVLVRYRALAAIPGLTSLPPLPAGRVKPGQVYVGAPALRRLLTELGDLAPTTAPRDDLILDGALSAALRQFQFRHGLRQDGTLGRDTFAALTTPLMQRVRQIELTLERWHWIPRMRPPTIIVNIPQFRLFFFRSGEDREERMVRMNVIVGRQFSYTRTPVFAADMNAIIFRPYWDVPSDISRRELVPHLRRDPAYLDSQNMELVPTQGPTSAPVPVGPQAVQELANGQLRARQRPGADNALGLIKFVLPNAYDVYLHSTPAQQLFNEPSRAFSHGCIRVSDPVGLAVEVLRGTGGDWSAGRIEDLMHGEVTLRVPLTHPVQVLILYGTAIASEDGAVHFFADLYGYDRRLEGLLGLAPAAQSL
jgi:murein L,D-transpeptidase YcbB/YkuD